MPADDPIPTRAWAELVLLAVIWGGSFIGNKIALVEFGVLSTVALRVFGGAILLWAYVLWRGLPLPKGARIWGIFLVMGALNNAIPFTLITWGQVQIASGLAAIFNASTAIFGVLVAAALIRAERLTPARLLGTSIGFAGVLVTMGPAALTGFDLSALAQWALIGAAVSYAFAASFARLKLRDLPPQVAAAGMLTGATFWMLPLALGFEGVPHVTHSTQGFAALVYLIAVSTAFAYLLYYRVLAMAGAGNLTFVTLITAPVAVLAGALMLHESIPARAYPGFALLALGLIVIDGRLWRKFRVNSRA